jgi:hypothetical protein
MPTKLTTHFTIEELIYSETANKLHIVNVPTSEHIENMRYCCENILEPVRAFFNKPVKINSSYRCPALNKAVGGALTSQHCNGQAIDFEILGVSNRVLADYVAENLVYDQVILEFYTDGKINSGWVHGSIKKDGSNRKSKLIAIKDGTSTKYIPANDFDPSNEWKQF